MARSPEYVEYRLPPEAEGSGNRQLAVRRLNKDDLHNLDVGRACVKLLVRAYANQLENPENFSPPHNALSRGDVTRAYRGGAREQLDSMQKRVRKGAHYWVATLSPNSLAEEEDAGYAGLLRVDKSRATLGQRIHASKPNLYVGNIAADPTIKIGIGSCLMHTAVSYAGFAEDRIAALHAYAGSSVNEWFEEVGFKEQKGPLRLEPFNGDSASPVLGQILMSSETLTLSTIKEQLELKRTWLGGAQDA